MHGTVLSDTKQSARNTGSNSFTGADLIPASLRSYSKSILSKTVKLREHLCAVSTTFTISSRSLKHPRRNTVGTVKRKQLKAICSNGMYFITMPCSTSKQQSGCLRTSLRCTLAPLGITGEYISKISILPATHRSHFLRFKRL